MNAIGVGFTVLRSQAAGSTRLLTQPSLYSKPNWTKQLKTTLFRYGGPLFYPLQRAGSRLHLNFENVS
ncbi:MAG: hypothetical protein DYH05_12495 [Acidobacteria bacterium ACB1]|nr:hypothetical protein [Acidobacteria bacterium ACB1]